MELGVCSAAEFMTLLVWISISQTMISTWLDTVYINAVIGKKKEISEPGGDA
jgi:hypothetical protein